MYANDAAALEAEGDRDQKQSTFSAVSQSPSLLTRESINSRLIKMSAKTRRVSGNTYETGIIWTWTLPTVIFGVPRRVPRTNAPMARSVCAARRQLEIVEPLTLSDSSRV